jgi:transposase-like protein
MEKDTMPIKTIRCYLLMMAIAISIHTTYSMDYTEGNLAPYSHPKESPSAIYGYLTQEAAQELSQERIPQAPPQQNEAHASVILAAIKPLMAHESLQQTRKGGFTCKTCGRSFTRPYSLTQHMIIHTKERPFKCPVPGCPYAAKRKRNLQSHATTHTKEKSFRCTIPGCLYIAKRQSDLTKHIKTHTDEKRFKCPICNYATAWRSNLIRHMRTQHPDQEHADLVQPAAQPEYAVVPRQAGPIAVQMDATDTESMAMQLPAASACFMQQKQDPFSVLFMNMLRSEKIL